MNAHAPLGGGVDEVSARAHFLGKRMAEASTEPDLQRFFRLSCDMLCIAGFDGYFKTISPALSNTLGYTLEELTAGPFIEFIHADDRARVLAEMAQLMAGGVTVSFEIRMYANDGSLRHLSWNASADLDKKLFYGFARDVGAQQRALEALHRKLELQRGVLDGANYSIISTDTQGVILSFNSAAERMLGYSAAEVIGKLTPEVMHDVAEVAQRAAQLTRELGVIVTPGFDVFVEQSRRGIAEEREWTYIRKDGSRFPVLLCVTALRDAHGAVSGFMGIAADISARKIASAQLESFKSTLDQTLDCVFMFTPDTLQFFYVNQGAAAQVGYSREELLAMHPYDIKPDFPEARFRQFIEPLLRGEKQSVIFETWHQGKDGSRVPVEVFLQYIAAAEQSRFVAIVRDITERKRLEQMKNQFVSTMSHELRTPMNAILGFTQLLGYDSNLTDAQKANLTKVRKAGEHLLNLINEVLDLSRIEAGNAALSLESVALDAVLLECLNLAQPLADARHVRLHVEVESAAGHHVRADSTRLSQVLINLISNAVKYNHPGGCVWVTCAPGAPGHVRIAVRDDGRGIAPAQQAQLFQPFNRLGAERGEIEGTGIGLTISKQLVELMRGEIGWVSTPGAGSTFWVDFLQQSAAPARRPRIDRNTAPSVCNLAAMRRMLYVEDHPANLALVRALCTQFWPQMQLLTATSAEMGLELAAAQPPDLILMDINLPGMDGYQALAQLRADATLRHIPVLAITANAMQADIERGQAAGFAGYLTKPLDIAKFLAVLNEVLPGSAACAAPPVAPTAPAAGAAPILDEHATGQLRDLLGAHAVPIIDSLLSDLPQRMALLRDAIEHGDVAAVRHQAHAMKGSSSNLGASAFAALCARLSGHCKAGELQCLPAMCAQLEQEFHECVTPALTQFKQELLCADQQSRAAPLPVL